MTARVRRDGRKERGDRARGAVLARAVQLASIEGIRGVTLGQLAADVGISKGNLTVLFGEKQALQLATIEAARQLLIDQVVTPALKRASPIQRLKALCDGWFSHVGRRDFAGGCLMYATIHECRAQAGALHDAALRNFDDWRRLLGRQLKDARNAGEIAESVRVRDIVTVLASYQNLAHLAATMGDEATFRRCKALSSGYIASLVT